jgi:XTP/dITP diphosphohydrolase
MPHNSFKDKAEAFTRLLKIMDDLREKCPWDRKQTIHSLRSLTIEETYELADSIADNDWKGLKEEIGDVLLHLIFYAKIGEEQGKFDIADAIHAECEKLIYRHPHIYGDVKVENEEDVKRNWEQLKLKEGKKSVLAGVPRALPAIIKSFRMQEKAAKVGFDWETKEQVWDKVQEEIGELKEAIALQSHDKMEDEFGDVLFSLVNYARFIGVDPESALERTNKKFKKRFEYVENHAPKPLQEMTLAEMDALWNDAKIANT